MPISPLLSFPLMLATYKTTVQRKLISVQCLLLIKSLYLNFIIFPQYPFFFVSQPNSKSISYFIAMSLCDGSSFFPCLSWLWYFWWVLTSQNASQLGYVWCFLMVRLRLCIWGQEDHKGGTVPFSVHYGRGDMILMFLDHSVKAVSAGPSTNKLTIFPLLIS